VLQQLEEAEPEGTTTGVIARAINYDQPNVYLTLQGLANAGQVEKDVGKHPRRGHQLRPEEGVGGEAGG
jgi:hypothetical protein